LLKIGSTIGSVITRRTTGACRLRQTIIRVSYSSTKDAHLSDEELGIMALEAWRNHLRNMHDYLPDRVIPPATHLDHVKVLNAAITDYKRQWSKLELYGKGLLDYKHDQYALICRKYNIPVETCSLKELMGAVERKDMNVVYRIQCRRMSSAFQFQVFCLTSLPVTFSVFI
jgi:hypothetical protein